MTLEMGYWTGTTINWAQPVLSSSFGDPHYSQSIAECGVSGVSTSQLSFEVLNTAVPYPDHTAAPVRLDGGKIFWVNNRNVGRYTTTFTCLDSVALLDVPVDCTLGRYTGHDSEGNYYISAAGIVEQVRKAGRGLSLSGLESPTDYGFPLNIIQGKTLIQLLTEASEMMGGFYAVNNVNQLVFVYANNASTLPGHQVSQHSYVERGGTFQYEHALFVGMPDYAHGTDPGTASFAPLPDTMYPYATDVTNYTTLEVNGTFAPYAKPAANFSFVGSTTFQEWRVENAVIYNIPVLGDNYSFLQDSYATGYRLTDCEVRWVGNTMIASLGGGIPSTGELARRSRRQMEIDNKIEEGKAYGNTLLTRYQGTIFKAVEGTQNADS